MYLLEISMQAKAKKQLFKLFTILFKHFYFSCLHEMIKERKVCLRFSWQFILYFQNVDPRVFWSFWYIRQRAVLIYWKEQETLGSRLFYFCINLIITWAPGPVWGLFSDKWWTFAFPCDLVMQIYFFYKKLTGQNRGLSWFFIYINWQANLRF